ncbi:MAG TPA: copper resistance protein CopC [Terriglobales bacterium]|nr:copper resistance protein CopC [Terriglobales bacterium]
MPRRNLTVVILVTLLGVLSHSDAWAHAGLRSSDPMAGATLGDTPTRVRLTFLEKPEPSLSIIHVLDTRGTAYQIGPTEGVAGDPQSLVVRVRHLDRGVYIVSWRVISALDGHATNGSYAFGVRATPTGAAIAAVTFPSGTPPLEMLARWLFLVGLIVMLGGAAANVARFGGTSDLKLAVGGWVLAVAGLLFLAEAQRRNAATSFAHLLVTSVGKALIWRALALLIAGGALLMTRRAPQPQARRAAMAAVALSALAVMAVHVASGHAAAGRWPLVSISTQWAHFGAAGVWLGGLAALLLGTRGAPSTAKTAVVRRFSPIAAVGLLVVAATGTLRALNEVSSWAEFTNNGYGRVLIAKFALVVLVAALGARNRWRSVPAVPTNLGPLRWTAGGELALACAALAAAAALGTMPPPAAARLVAPPVFDVSGADFATTVRVRLTTGSDQPGPNRFAVQIVDYDAKTPVRAELVSLRFIPLDDPDFPPTSLALAASPDGSYTGSGANLAFDGRWRVTVLIERTSGSSQVPLELEVGSTLQFVSIERIPGQAPKYTVALTTGDSVRISPDPERAGPSKIYVTCFNRFSDAREIEHLMVTIAAGDGSARPQAVQRLDGSRFVVDVDLQPGKNKVMAIAKTSDGTRLRAAVTLSVPGD